MTPMATYEEIDQLGVARTSLQASVSVLRVVR